MMAPKSRQLAPAISRARQRLQLTLDGGGDGIGKGGGVGHEDRLRGAVVFGLREQIGGDPVGIVFAIGDDQDLRGAGDHVDADGAEDHALGGGDVGVARPHDLVHRRDRRGAVGERGDRLRAADPIDLVDAGDARGGEHQRVHLAFGRRRHHDDALDAGDAGRNGVHQNRTRIGGGAARHVKPDRLDGGPTQAQLDALGIGVAIVGGHLAGVERLDAIAREQQRVAFLRPARSSRRGRFPAR